jgi:holo-[acyl-carrier protein] synthase
VDFVEVARVADALDRHGDRLLRRVFTAAEIAYCEGRRNRLESYAARLAAKEALLKALGTGWGRGLRWVEIEVARDAAGQPTLQLTGKAGALATARGVTQIRLSLSHTREHALASVVCLCEGAG